MARHCSPYCCLAAGALLALMLPFTFPLFPKASAADTNPPARLVAFAPPGVDAGRAPTGGSTAAAKSSHTLAPGAGPAALGQRYGTASQPLSIDQLLLWSTFLGGPEGDSGQAIAVDGGGHIYVIGSATGTWGSPLHAHSGGSDAYVAKLTWYGSLIWHTFLGGAADDFGRDIAVDASGQIYVAGYSHDTQGPVETSENWVAKLDGDGAVIWNTALAPLRFHQDGALALDGSGSVYFLGSVWRDNEAFGDWDAYVTRLDGAGTPTWTTFLGKGFDPDGPDTDYGTAIAVDAAHPGTPGGHDGSGVHVYVTGRSDAPWGAPLRAHSGGDDAFVAKLDGDGALLWNSFLGGPGTDGGNGIDVDATRSSSLSAPGGQVYVTGASSAAWGSPLRAHSGASDAFVARLEGDGSLTWNSFLGQSGADGGNGIAVDGGGQVYVAGASDGSWGSPLQAYSGDSDAFAARLNPDGSLIWNAFLGGPAGDGGHDIAVDAAHPDGGRGGRVHMTGSSDSTWGSPAWDYSGDGDAFVVHLAQPCLGDGIYLYEHANYGGRCRLFATSDPDLPLVAFNDIASSIRFVGSYGGGRYTASLYEHSHYGGVWTAFGADDADFGDDVIGHDEASSIRIEAVWDGPRIYLPAVLRSGGDLRE